MFFERPDSGEKAILVHVAFQHWDDQADAREFEELVLSAAADPMEFLFAQRARPDPKYFIGSGKTAELAAMVAELGAEVVIFNHSLSPSQERNIEREVKCRVLDRVSLILDIFAQRARTHEGKLQVELAQLHHMSTRLVRGWTHLERQKGGIGLRGPGETQLETDRRLLRARIRSLTARLDKVRKQRQQGRRARQRADLPTVSLVGYTNAGKSTLFNRLTESDVYAEDQLFATLDPTMRRLMLDEVGPVVLADTVGFISNLPHRLVEAFSATLEEVASADLLLHVVDAAGEDPQSQMADVQTVLEEIEAADSAQLIVYNKVDKLAREPRIDRNAEGEAVAVWCSAVTGEGMDLVLQAMRERLAVDMLNKTLILLPAQSRLRAKLYEYNGVVGETYQEDGSSDLQLRMPRADLLRLLSAEAMCWEQLNWRG